MKRPAPLPDTPSVSRIVVAAVAALSVFAVGVGLGLGASKTGVMDDHQRQSQMLDQHHQWEDAYAAEHGVVVSEAGRSLDAAVREDLGMTGEAEWDAYGRTVRATLGGLLAAGVDPGDIGIDALGRAQRLTPGRAAPAAPDYGTSVPAAGAAVDPLLAQPVTGWPCSPGLPVTVTGDGHAEGVWLTAAHCVTTRRAGSAEPPVWADVFGGDTSTPTASSAIATRGVDDTLDFPPDYGLTRRATIPLSDDKPADAVHYTAALPPVPGMRVCSATRHGWRCGVIDGSPHPGVVSSTTYATPGDSGSIAGVGGAAVYVLAWSRGPSKDWGTAMGYSVAHIIDHAASNGWDLAIGWPDGERFFSSPAR